MRARVRVYLRDRFGLEGALKEVTDMRSLQTHEHRSILEDGASKEVTDTRSLAEDASKEVTEIRLLRDETD